jgi:hypothetical protein
MGLLARISFSAQNDLAAAGGLAGFLLSLFISLAAFGALFLGILRVDKKVEALQQSAQTNAKNISKEIHYLMAKLNDLASRSVDDGPPQSL